VITGLDPGEAGAYAPGSMVVQIAPSPNELTKAAPPEPLSRVAQPVIAAKPITKNKRITKLISNFTITIF
jgi:hypothetical protein